MNNKEIVEAMFPRGTYDYAKFITKWNGYDVFLPAFNENREILPALGIPPYILVKDGVVRCATDRETQEIS